MLTALICPAHVFRSDLPAIKLPDNCSGRLQEPFHQCGCALPELSCSGSTGTDTRNGPA